MASDPNEIHEDDFFDRYKPKDNPLTEEGPWNNAMLETYGEELEIVKNADPSTVWTLVDDGENQCITAGFHYVNRMGYFITEIPWVTGNEWVSIEDLTDHEDEETEDEE